MPLNSPINSRKLNRKHLIDHRGYQFLGVLIMDIENSDFTVSGQTFSAEA